jgi:GT2 family glycosyltransferase
VIPEQALAAQLKDAEAEVERLRALVADKTAQAREVTSHLQDQRDAVATAQHTARGLAEVNGDLARSLEQVRVERAQLQVRATAAEVALERARAELDITETQLRTTRQAEQVSRARAAQVEFSALGLLLSRYRRFVERVAPPGRRRRRAYAAGTARMRRMLSRGRAPARQEPVVSPALQVGFARPAAPDATVLIPAHGQWPVTARCLESLAAAATVARFEVLVVDDASPDASRANLAAIPGVEVVELDTNVGFVRACNAGFPRASGRYVVLLNNDTEVRDGWLDALIAAAESDSRVGLVGAKLLSPGGTLQEAGGIIFSDGSPWNFGRGDSPDGAPYQHPRDVDYCSGACLLLSRDLLTSVGGFDERFAPAYFEDVDLAFSARKHGFRVRYEPRAEVVHHEGLSHGTDLGQGVKRYEALNRSRFVAKWGDELAGQWEPGPARVAVASRRSERGHLLVVDHQVPRPDHDAGSLRMWCLLEALCDAGYAVTFLADDLLERQPYVDDLRRLGVHVAVGVTDVPGLIGSLAADLVAAVLSRPGVAWRYLTLLRERAPGSLVIYDTVDLHYVREERRAVVEANPSVALVAGAWRELEVGLARASDITLTVSAVEAAALGVASPGIRVVVVPTVHVVRGGSTPFAQRRGLLFVGNCEHPPNEDAIRWFVREIFPDVRAQLPDVTLTIAGTGSAECVGDLAGGPVIVAGWVADLDDLHDAARCFVAPLRFGAGVKGKIGESLARGLPVVTTRIGAEGLGIEHGECALIGDDPREFADLVVRIYRDPDLWAMLARNGTALVRRNFSPEMAAGALRTLLIDGGATHRGVAPVAPLPTEGPDLSMHRLDAPELSADR